MIPKRIINCAIEGGWMPPIHDDPLKDEIIEQVVKDPYRASLDPTFWQALGKALGWNRYGSNILSVEEDPSPYWLTRAKRFYDIIRAACIKANPEITRRPSMLSFNGRKPIGVPDNNGPEIRLADVLLAINANTGMDKPNIGFDGRGLYFNNSNRHVWNLRLDDLTQQSPETLQFLADLLK